MKHNFRLTVKGKRVWSGNDRFEGSRRFYGFISGNDWKDAENLVRLESLTKDGKTYEIQAWGDVK